MNRNELNNTLLRGERISLECKKAKNEVPKSVWETYSSFANTLGGDILLGMEEDLSAEDNAGRFTVVGVDNPGKIKTDLWNTLNSDKVSCNVLVDDDVSEINVDDKVVVCIHVPQADFTQRPVYINGNPIKGSFRRNHEGDYHCTEEEVRAMMRDANAEGNDSMLVEYYGMDDIDPDSLRQYRTEFRVLNSGHTWNNLDDKDFLKQLGGYVIDRRSGKEGLSLAGLLMFGKGLPVRERFSNFRMDYVDMSHLVGDERYHDRLTYDGRWENNLYQFFHLVNSKLTMDLPRPFKLEGVRRVDDTPQHKAVREAFTNSIIHSDMFLSGGILRIDKYDDRLCFRNPGILKLPMEQVYAGGSSKARNPKMQNMLRMIGYGENLGSGFPKILAAWKEAGWQEPVLENRFELDEVRLTLFIPFVETIQKTTQETTQETTYRRTELQNAIMEYLVCNPSATRKELAEAIPNCTVDGIKYNLGKLQKMGVITRVGSTKSGHWKVLVDLKGNSYDS